MEQKKVYNLPIIVEHDQEGYFVSCPSLQGCFSEGKNYEEAIENIKEAITLHLEDREEGESEISETSSVSLSSVAVSV